MNTAENPPSSLPICPKKKGHWYRAMESMGSKKVESLRHNFPEKYPEDAETCFIVIGNAFFETEIVSKRIKELAACTPIQTFGNLLVLVVGIFQSHFQ